MPNITYTNYEYSDKNLRHTHIYLKLLINAR